MTCVHTLQSCPIGHKHTTSSWPGFPPGLLWDPYGSRTQLLHFAREVVILNKVRTKLQPSWEVFLQHDPGGGGWVSCRVGCPRACGRTGRCKVRWDSVGDRGLPSWCSFFYSGNSPWCEGHQIVFWRMLLEEVQTRANKQPNDPVSEPSPCPSSIYHCRHFPLKDLQHLVGLYTSSSWIPPPHAQIQGISSQLSQNLLIPGLRVTGSFPGTEVTLPSTLYWLLLEQNALSEIIWVKAANKCDYLPLRGMNSMVLLPWSAVETRGIKRDSTGNLTKLTEDKSFGSTM